MGRYFIYENTPVHDIRIHHAKTVEEEDRVRSILTKEPETYRHINNFPDVDSVMCWADTAFNAECTLNLIFHKEWNVPVTFYYDHEQSNQDSWHFFVRASDSPYIKAVEFTEEFYNTVCAILNDLGLDTAFTSDYEFYATERV